MTPVTRVRPRRRRRRRGLRPLLLLVLLAAVFLVGIALGEALHDRPDTGGTQTLVRTLEPLPLVPVAGGTVSVTVTTTTGR